MARQWKCAIVGMGTVGDWHARVLPQVTGCELVAVCDVDPARAKGVLEKNKLNVPIYTDSAEMYRKEKIDSVHVCTPSGDHLDPAMAAMKAGKNVVVEKPMEITTDRIDQMIEASKKHGVKLAGIFQNRWNEANRAIRDAAQAGRFGRIAWAGAVTPWYRTDEYYVLVPWRGTWKLDGGGAVMNQGIHSVDLLQWVIGPVKTVSAYAASRIHASIEVEDTLTCAMQFANGAFGTFVSTTAMYPGGAVRLEVGGEFGMALSENGLKRYEFKDARAEDKELLDRLDPSRVQNLGGAASNQIGLDLHGLNIQSIYQAWDKGQEAETDGPEARKAIAITQAMYASVKKNGAAVDVK